MFKRSISPYEVETTINEGEIIRSYPNDTPFPSCLLLSFVQKRAIHVVVSKDERSGNCIIITAYEPDTSIWAADFKTKNS
jgi:hypothetical protein